MSDDLDFSRLIAHTENVRQMKAGDWVFQIGDDASELYVVKSGQIDILVDGVSAEVVRAGGILGEMALIDSSPRSADAKCRSDAEIVAITEKQFKQLIQEMPSFALDVMRVLDNRLRSMNADQTTFY